AILFPVFAQARERARQTSCLSNLKQIGTALNLYVDDYDETLPFMCDYDKHATGGEYDNYPCNKLGTTWINLAGYDDSWPGGYNGRQWTWADCIFPYVKNVKLYVCPSSTKNAHGYGYNWALCDCHSSASEGSPLCLAQTDNTAELVFVGDAPKNKGIDHTIIRLSPEVIHSTAAYPDYYSSAIRHNGGLNYCFCDGHAKYYKATQGPGVNGDWYNLQTSKVHWWNPGY
ncbi:MAG: DUF1559 domain-containing protein, partial [Armatimonadetes bacterium]|nr:DUF1559 domain-containing protein [Candidatus Hippobium faecium]